jgi:hypothetical protein
MTDDDERIQGGFSLRRWSRRKLEASRAAATPPAPAPLPASPPAVASEPPIVAAPAAGEGAAPGAAPSALPPVESLEFGSDFTQFLQPKVEETVRRAALRKLFQDPRFNVMDGLDVYIDDYSIPDPIEPEVARALHHAKSIFAPTKTRVNAEGHVEDVPPDEPAPAPQAPPGLPEPERAAPPMATLEPDAATDAARERVARDDGPRDDRPRDERRRDDEPSAA